MQISPRTGYEVEKVFRDSDGRLVRATFYVYQSGTRLRARLLKSEFVEVAKQITEKVFSLPNLSNIHRVTLGNKKIQPIVSPFFTTNQLYFSGSKPRAPTQ